MRLFTHDELNALSNCLRSAAERYTEHAATVREELSMREDSREAMAAQFDGQRDQAKRFADTFDNLPQVLISTCEHCANETEHPPKTQCADGELLRFIRNERLA